MVNVKMQVLSDKSVVFEGDTYVSLMSKLTDAGLTPMNMSDIMRARLEAISSKDPGQHTFWFDHYFDSTDGVAYSSNTIKIVPNAQALKDIGPETKLSKGALILTPKEYADLDGEEFSLGSLQKAGLNQSLRKLEVLSHPVWRALARDDHLLKEFADAIFAGVKERYDVDRAMGIYYLPPEQELPNMRAWFVGGLGDGSNAGGNGHLDYGARRVGVRAEGAAQRDTLDEAILDEGILDEAILDNKVSDSSGVERSFTFNGRVFVPFHDTEDGNGEL